MAELIISPSASGDLAEIEDYFATELFLPESGELIVDRIIEVSELTAQMPLMHQECNDFWGKPLGLRCFAVGDWVVYYRVPPDLSLVEIVRVLHKTRQVRGAMFA